MTEEALKLAETELRSAEKSTELMKFVSALPFWNSYLKHTFARRFATLNAPYEQRMHDVYDQALTLEDAVYRDRMSAILQEQRQAEQAQLEQLTEDALKIDHLGLCTPASP